jgi:hypothetical protein
MIPDGTKDLLGTLGNSNVLWGYLSVYEKAVAAGNETTKGIAQAPNYYAWLATASEYVYSQVKETLFLMGGATEPALFDADYKRVLNRIFADPKMTPALRDDILLFARIRHLVVHKGFPNTLTAPANAERELAAGVVYDFQAVKETAERVGVPAEFPALKEAFRRVLGGLRSVRGPIEIGF